MRILVIPAAIGAALIFNAPTNADIGAFRRTVQSYYQQNNIVQRAIYRDACLHWDMRAESRTARARLGRANRAAYDKVSALMGEAYAASEGTDSAVEQVQKDFCTAADMR